MTVNIWKSYMWTAVEQKEYGSDPHSYEHYLRNSENKAWKNSGFYGTSGINFHYCVTARITSIFVSSTIVHTYNFHIPYLPVYNARLCIIRTLIFYLFCLKKRFQDTHQDLKLPFFHLTRAGNSLIICLKQFLTSCYYKYRTHRALIYKPFYSITVKRFTNVVTWGPF